MSMPTLAHGQRIAVKRSGYRSRLKQRGFITPAMLGVVAGSRPRGGVGPSPDPTPSNVMFLLHGTATPWYDVGYVGYGVENRGATVETTIKPTWSSGSFKTTGTSTGARAPNDSTGPFNLGAAFMVEAWVYSASDGGTRCRIFDTRTGTGATNGFVFVVQSSTGYPFFQYNGTAYGVSSPTPTGNVPLSTWTHVRATYDGTTLRIFVNGTITWSSAVSINITNSSHMAIGNSPGIVDGNTSYLCDMRVVKGEAVSTANFAVQTAPLSDSGATISQQTNVAYSNVLWRFPFDSDVADKSTYARTVTQVGGANFDTSVKKFGAGSLLLGSGKWLTFPDASELDIGTVDYQFQCWAYRNGSKSNDPTIFSNYTSSSTGYSISINASTKVPYWNETGDGVDGAFVTALTDVTWVHVAVGRKNGVLYTFIDGVLERFVSSSQNVLSAGTQFIGLPNASFTAYYWIGNLDDMQLAKGECRLFRSFLVPTAALPVS